MSTFDDARADELVSAVLDGVATPGEVDQVLGDPALRARLAEFRAVRAAVGQAPAPLPAPTVDAMVDQALDSFGTSDVDTTEPDRGRATTMPTWSDHQGPGRARGKASVRHDRRPRSRRFPPLAIAAALVVVAGLGLFLALTATSKTHSPTARRQSANRDGAEADKGTANARSSPDAVGGAASSNAVSPASPAGPPAPGAIGLGVFGDQTALSQDLAQLDPQTLHRRAGPGTAQSPSTGYVPSTAELSRCDAVIRGHVDRALTDRLAVAGATLENRSVIVASYRAPASGNKPAGIEIVVADATSCYPVVTQTH